MGLETTALVTGGVSRNSISNPPLPQKSMVKCHTLKRRDPGQRLGDKKRALIVHNQSQFKKERKNQSFHLASGLSDKH